MKRLLCFVLFLIATDVLAQPDSEPEVGRVDTPDWVEVHEIGGFSKDRDGQFQLGTAYLLSDRQLRKTATGYEFFERQSYEVVDRTGLESAATIVQVFDPVNSTVNFNYVRVIRDGAVVDRLPDTEITLLRQEEGLDSSLIDGNLTALIQLEDVRVGDIVDYAVSGTVDIQLWPGELFDVVSVEWSMPLARNRYSVSIPEDVNLSARSVATDIEPTVRTENGWTTYSLDIQDPDPTPAEQSVPEDWLQYGFVVFSTMEEWADVVNWALPLFSFDEPLPESFRAQLDEIAAGNSDPKTQVSEVLRLVQNDIRYLGIEIGLGSHVPRPPSETLTKGYGDCKDKSVLLVAALNYLNLDAVPALASVSAGKTLMSLPPTVEAFDHVVVQLEVDDKRYWVDPTLSHQGGMLDTLSPLDYGAVLPIRQGQTGLVEMETPFPELPLNEVFELFEFPEDDEVGLRLTVEITSRQNIADFSRQLIAGTGRDQFARGLLDFYAGTYPGIVESSPLTISDDLENNVVTYRVAYEILSDVLKAGDLASELPVVATSVQGSLPRRVEADRTAPLGLPFGINARHVVRVSTPGRMMMIVPDETSETTAGITYNRKFTKNGESFDIEYMLQIRERVAEPLMIKSITDLSQRIREESDISIYVDRAVPTVSKLLQLESPLDPATEQEIMEIRTKILESDNVEALAGLSSLIDKYSAPDELVGFLHLEKATVLMELDRDSAAIAPFETAFSLFEPSNPRSYFSYVTALSRNDDKGRAAEVLTLLLTRHPTAINNLNVDWFSYFVGELWDLELTEEAYRLQTTTARTLHETQSEKLDDLRWVFVDAVEHLSKTGKRNEAITYLEYLRNPRTIVDLLSSVDAKPVWSAIEKRWGKGVPDAFTEYVVFTREQAVADPGDYLAKATHVEALRMAGHLDEARDYAEPIIEDWSRIEATGEDAYWFVNEFAYVLSNSGAPEDAFAILKRLEDLGIRENGALVSMAINHIALMQGWGEFDASLQGVTLLEEIGDEVASDYGWMWIYASKACALYQLDMIDEAESVLADSIKPLADKNAAAYTETMLCMGKFDEAAESYIRRLEDESEKGTALRAFVESDEVGVVPPFLSELHERAAEVRMRPEVQNALRKVGRVVEMQGVQPYWGMF